MNSDINNKKNFIFNPSSGISLVEAVVGIGILFLAITGLITSYNIFTKAGLRTMNNVQATFLIEEGFEIMHTLRDHGWTSNISSLSGNTNYYFAWSGGRWVTTTTATTTDGTFNRYMTISSVNRDANDAIASSGTNDPNTKKITIYVSWDVGSTTITRSSSGYLMNLFSN